MNPKKVARFFVFPEKTNRNRTEEFNINILFIVLTYFLTLASFAYVL